MYCILVFEGLICKFSSFALTSPYGHGWNLEKGPQAAHWKQLQICTYLSSLPGVLFFPCPTHFDHISLKISIFGKKYRWWGRLLRPFSGNFFCPFSAAQKGVNHVVEFSAFPMILENYDTCRSSSSLYLCSPTWWHLQKLEQFIFGFSSMTHAEVKSSSYLISLT